MSEPDTQPEGTRGVVYVATCEPYLSEARQSARSLRDHHPDLPITLFAPEGIDDETAAVFDDVRAIDDAAHDFSDSILGDGEIAYDRTLFLDTDTYVCGSLEPIFEVLDRFDLAAAQDPAREGTASHRHDHDVPETFPQFNTGVIAYRDCAAVRDLFDRWRDLYHSLEGVKHGLNQPAFRVAAYESDLDIGTLPPEYNFRIGNVANSVLYACGLVRIVHGRSMHWSLADAAAAINATDERRAVVAKPHPELITDSDRSASEVAAYAADRAQWAYRKNGAVSMLLTVGSMAKEKVVR